MGRVVFHEPGIDLIDADENGEPVFEGEFRHGVFLTGEFFDVMLEANGGEFGEILLFQYGARFASKILFFDDFRIVVINAKGPGALDAIGFQGFEDGGDGVSGLPVITFLCFRHQIERTPFLFRNHDRGKHPQIPEKRRRKDEEGVYHHRPDDDFFGFSEFLFLSRRFHGGEIVVNHGFSHALLVGWGIRFQNS